MTDPIREHLLGYLLGADEPEERLLVEKHLAENESLRSEMELFKGLQPLSADEQHHEPPHGLAQRCCDYVFTRTEVMPAALSQSGTTNAPRQRWSWLEMTVAGTIAAAVAVFLLPKIYESQVQSKLLACQNNLKDIGLAAMDYSRAMVVIIRWRSPAIGSTPRACGRRRW